MKGHSAFVVLQVVHVERQLENLMRQMGHVFKVLVCAILVLILFLFYLCFYFSGYLIHLS